MDTLKSEIQKALVRCVDTSNEIANEEFRSLIKRITKGARKKYSLSNQEIHEITGLSKGALSGSGAIFDLVRLYLFKFKHSFGDHWRESQVQENRIREG